MDELERRFARFGAMVVQRRWLGDPGFGFVGTEGSLLDGFAEEAGLMNSNQPNGEHYPVAGTAEVAARLLRPAPSNDELLAIACNAVAELARALGLKVDTGEVE